jgi:peptidoglycan/xylan/chitin deacetylase (PgdA/CDA1 family)
MKPFSILVLLSLTALSGCSSVTIPSVEATVKKTDGVRNYSVSSEIDIAPLMPFMRRASWSDRWILWKTSVDVVLSDGKKVYFERLQPIFRIEGIKGTFLVIKEDIPAYEILRDRIVIGGNK